ncbi:MAG: DNA polymerase IV, partial [Megasphaera micronuciformis]|nr:DNA polymerase IV [Megasphaera micronuciformis]
KTRKGSVRLLGITVSKLQTAIIQDSLFAKDPITQKRLADEKVTTAIDKLQERFGKRAVMKGFLWEAESSVKEVKEKE